jgi:hypothetical protein
MCTCATSLITCILCTYTRYVHAQVELLEDLMLTLCRRSAHLAVKLIWWVRGYLEDLSEISASGVNSDAPGKKVRQSSRTRTPV